MDQDDVLIEFLIPEIIPTFTVKAKGKSQKHKKSVLLCLIYSSMR